MGAPAYDLADLDFDNQDDPELLELLGSTPSNDHADLLDDHSDLLDSTAANDNATGGPAATPEQVREAQRAYEAERPEEVPQLREMGFEDPDAPAPSAQSKVVHVTGPGGAPILIEGDPNAPEPPKSGLQYLAEGAGDLARGVGQGATLRWGDEGAAALVEMAPREGGGLDTLARKALNLFGADLPGVDPEAAAIPKTYAAGSRYEDMRDSERAANAAAQERSPVLYGAGEVAGAVPGAIASAPAAGGTLPARIAASMAAGGAYGGVSGAGGSEADDALGVASDALQGAEVGAALGGGLTAGAAKVGQWAQSARPGLERLANRWRAGASGAYGGELARLTERHGPQYAERLGADIERLGLHKRPGGKAANLLPSTPGVYRANAEALRKQLAADIGQSIDDATSQGVSYPKADLLASMRNKLRAIGTDTPEDVAVRKQIRGLMARIDQKHGEYLTPRQLHALKKSYENAGGFAPTRNMPAGDARTAKMYRSVAGAPRQALEESVAEQALPETAAKFAQARGDFGTARTVENLARKREAQEAGNMLVSLPAAATGSLPGAAFVEGVKRVGKDVAADAARGTASKMRGLQTLADAVSGRQAVAGPSALPMARGLPTRALPTGQAAGVAAGASIPRGVPASVMATDEQRAEAVAGARGHQLEAAVRDAAERNPQALGPYAQRIQEAVNSSNDDALIALLYELEHDETFRTQIAPSLTSAQQ